MIVLDASEGGVGGSDIASLSLLSLKSPTETPTPARGADKVLGLGLGNDR